MAKRISKLLLILSVVLLVLLFAGCFDNEFDVNNDRYRYLYEQDYGNDSVRVIQSVGQLPLQGVAAGLDLSKYDEEYFSKNYLLIFDFKTQYSESNLKVKGTKVVDGNTLLLNISINSPANYENVDFDAQISKKPLFVEVAKDSISDVATLRVGILVINEQFEGVYRSIYYDCSRKNMK